MSKKRKKEKSSSGRDELNWNGAPDEMLEHILIGLCRVKLRTTTFGKDGLSPVKRMGLVVGTAFDLARNMTDADAENVPTGEQIATRLNISKSAWSKFINGSIDARGWLRTADDALKLLILGTRAKDGDSRRPVLQEIREYFFGQDWDFDEEPEDHEEVPRYFRGSRTNWSSPWNHRETANEIRMVARRARYQEMDSEDRSTPKNCAITMVASGTPLFKEDLIPGAENKGLIRSALRDAATAGVPITLIAPKGSEAETAARDFEREHDGGAGTTNPVNVIIVDPAAKGTPDTWWHFFSPVQEYWILDSGFDGKKLDRSVYLVRSFRPKDDKKKHALTIDLNPEEASQFVDEWLPSVLKPPAAAIAPTGLGTEESPDQSADDGPASAGQPARLKPRPSAPSTGALPDKKTAKKNA